VWVFFLVLPLVVSSSPVSGGMERDWVLLFGLYIAAVCFFFVLVSFANTRQNEYGGVEGEDDDVDEGGEGILCHHRIVLLVALVNYISFVCSFRVSITVVWYTACLQGCALFLSLC
jgi:hypothetical protein